MKTGFLLISIIIIAIYIIMLILKKTKVLGIITHRKILNSALLISFLITAYSGISYVLLIDYGINIGGTRYHTTWGIIMIWIAIFHAFERRWFFTSIFKLKKKETSEVK